MRTVRLLGIQNALMSVLLNGDRMRPSKALKVGVVDELVGSIDELVPAAKAWITANPDGHVQPWDAPGFTIPGGTPSTPAFMEFLPAFPANLRRQLNGQPMPAPRAIMAAAVEGAQVDFDTASTIETRYFISLVTGQVAKNMIQAFFFDLQAVQRGDSRPKGVAKSRPTKVGIVGAGMMGAGIAYVTAKAGIDVVLKDVTHDAALKGRAYGEGREAGTLSRGLTTEERSTALLNRITPTADAADFEGVDIVVEAVFENTELKHQVFAEIEGHIDPDAVLGSNTSSLPITGLATGVTRPENFVGIHFFSPVIKMDPVEVIRGEQTSDEALAKAIDFVLAIGKYPIVVNDGRGFFTTRVFATFLTEAIKMLHEGIDPAVIEQAALQAGYPAGPLQLADELSFGTMRKIMDETLAAADRDGTPASEAARVSAGVIESMIGTQQCFDEGVIASDPDANIGSIMGIGFPPWTGGVRQFIAGYPGGRAKFVARAQALATAFGPRFEPTGAV